MSCHVGQVIRIDVLPDDVLLDIFDFYMDQYPMPSEKLNVEEWQSLVHVCRRWRSLVLGSPRRLNLRLYCTPETPAKDILDVWPALPLLIKGDNALTLGTDNIIAALGQSNRVCELILRHLTGWELEDVLAPMQVPFPELTVMQLGSHDKTLPFIPDSFLDGSAPRLEYFGLSGIPFPGLPKLLLSANHLVQLMLTNIPHSGHPRRWSLSSPCCPASEYFVFDSNPLDLTLTWKAEVCLHQNALFSPLSKNFISKALPNI
jgi:hypothetical protein